MKLVSLEPGSDKALARVRAETERVAPDWLRLEVANALSRKVRQGKLDVVHARAAMATLPTLLTGEINALTLMEKGFELSVQIGHGIYDCLYLAAAVEHDAVVVTADEQFAERAARSDYAAHVELLA